MKYNIRYSEHTDRRSSRQQWMEELGKINFEKTIYSKYYEPLEDNYDEESYP